jgi:hypothetical protein
MSTPCSTPISFENLVAYWAGDLESREIDSLDEHLMGCASCSAESERVASVVRALWESIPAIVTRRDVEGLRARGLRIRDNPVQPGDRRPVAFDPDLDILLHRLTELPLSGASRVDVKVTNEDDGALVAEFPDAPFDRGSSELLIACQRHFEVFPPRIVFDVSVSYESERGGERGERGEREGQRQARAVARYVVPHDFRPPH